MSKSSILFGYLAPLFSALVITGAIIALIIFSYMDWRAANKEASFTEYFPGSLDHQGKQFVKQPKSIAKKTSAYR